MDKTERGAQSFAEQPRVRQLRVSVVGGPDSGTMQTKKGDESIAIGSAADNELVMKDRMVSRYHLECKPCPEGIYVHDLGSLNGTFVGAVRVSEAWVPRGTRLNIGESILEVGEESLPGVASEEHGPIIPGFVAKSASMVAITGLLQKLAQGLVSVLIRGETGTGKELVAQAIHDLGPRSDHPMRVVDCGSLPAGLVASELFGHERGAFTGADQRRIGAFEHANGGTIFLDEIGELPMQVQPALLGALERRRFRRVGGRDEISVDVRVIAATHRDLRKEVNSGAFRADLYYRLAAARIEIPPLRKRPDDIEALVRYFVTQAAGSEVPLPFGEATIEALKAHPWAGNVRELRNVVEAALMLGSVTLESTGEIKTISSSTFGGEIPLYKKARADILEKFERKYFSKLIESCDGNASEAARLAGIHRGYLLSLLRRHGLR